LEVQLFLLQLLVLLVASRLLGEVFRKLHQPAVVGELLAGVVLGPSLLGLVAPGVHESLFPPEPGRLLPSTLEHFAALGVTLTMLAAGLEVDFPLLRRNTKATIWCAVTGTVLPLAIGTGAGFLFPSFWGAPAGHPPFVFALFLGINLAMSALPVIAKTLLDLGIYRTKIGLVILSSAAVDDLGVWILFSFLLALTGGPAEGGMGPLQSVLYSVAMLVGVSTMGRWAVDRLLPACQSRLPWPGGLVSFTVSAGLALAWLAMEIGIHPVFGSLLAGVVIGNSPSLRPGGKEVICDFVLSVFAPIFFATIGLRMDLRNDFDLPIVSWTLFLGCLSKLVGASAGARAAGMAWRESLAVGVGLNSRGIMGIVLGIVAFEHGLIGRPLFIAIAILSIFTSMISGPLLRLVLREERIAGADGVEDAAVGGGEAGGPIEGESTRPAGSRAGNPERREGNQ